MYSSFQHYNIFFIIHYIYASNWYNYYAIWSTPGCHFGSRWGVSSPDLRRWCHRGARHHDGKRSSGRLVLGKWLVVSDVVSEACLNSGVFHLHQVSVSLRSLKSWSWQDAHHNHHSYDKQMINRIMTTPDNHHYQDTWFRDLPWRSCAAGRRRAASSGEVWTRAQQSGSEERPNVWIPFEVVFGECWMV